MKTIHWAFVIVLLLRAGAVGAAFTGAYSPANWTITNTDGGGSITSSSESVALTSSNLGIGSFSNVDFTIVAPSSGQVSFDWAYLTLDINGSFLDPFGLLRQGSFAQLTTDTFIPGSQSGSVSFFVNVGETFGFSQLSLDGKQGAATSTITNFSASAPVPEPNALMLMLGGILGLLLFRIRRTLIGAVSPVLRAQLGY